jgi:hypothetical protein
MMSLGMLVWPTQAVLCYRMLPMQRSNAKVKTRNGGGVKREEEFNDAI